MIHKAKYTAERRIQHNTKKTRKDTENKKQNNDTVYVWGNGWITVSQWMSDNSYANITVVCLDRETSHTLHLDPEMHSIWTHMKGQVY